MKIAITGGTGFVGRHAAAMAMARDASVVLIARGHDRGGDAVRRRPGAEFHSLTLDDPGALASAFAGCTAVVHCAGINREIGDQTYARVHVEGTRNVVAAARAAGVRKIILISFLRARPGCRSGYHESKWAAEEIVRQSGIDHTILKCGVIYGDGDHMLDHLSHAFYTFPVFAFVGFSDQWVRPVAVEDVAKVIGAIVFDNALSGKTVPVLGPEQLTLREAVRRVSRVAGRRPLMFPLPVWFHYAFGWLAERIMTVPLVSVAQVRILREGLIEPCGRCDELPATLAPATPFSEAQIRKGLPRPEPFGCRDIAFCHR
jgi:uncharacterized protein YbjT (DUF2867 family)